MYLPFSTTFYLYERAHYAISRMLLNRFVFNWVSPIEHDRATAHEAVLNANVPVEYTIKTPTWQRYVTSYYNVTFHMFYGYS